MMLHLDPLATWGQAFSATLREPCLKWNQLNHLIFTVNVWRGEFSIYAAYYISTPGSWQPCFAWMMWSQWNEITSLVICWWMKLFYVHRCLFDSRTPVTYTEHLALFKCRQMDGFGDMRFILHAGLNLNCRCSPVSVCLGKSLQPPPVFTSFSVQRTPTDKIQVRVYIWATCCPTVVFLQAGNQCVLWIVCHYGWRIAPFTHFLGLSSCKTLIWEILNLASSVSCDFLPLRCFWCGQAHWMWKE